MSDHLCLIPQVLGRTGSDTCRYARHGKVEQRENCQWSSAAGRISGTFLFLSKSSKNEVCLSLTFIYSIVASLWIIIQLGHRYFLHYAIYRLKWKYRDFRYKDIDFILSKLIVYNNSVGFSRFTVSTQLPVFIMPFSLINNINSCLCEGGGAWENKPVHTILFVRNRALL